MWSGLAATSGQPRRLPLRVVAFGSAVVLLALTNTGGSAAPAPTPLAAAPPAAAAALPAPAGGGLPAEHAQPAELRIPSIRVRSALVDLGREQDGTLTVPSDYQVAGWYANGPSPGDAGGPPAVIAGHVDSTKGPAVFFRLRELKVGSDIQVRGIDGVVRHFTLYRLAEYAKATFPAADVYAPSKRAELRLITCTGRFDSRAGSYRSNLVAYAALAGGGS